MLCVSLSISLSVSLSLCAMGFSKPWGALSQNPVTCHKEPGKGAVKKGRRGPWIASQLKPQYRWALSHLASPWGQCTCARLFLSSVVFSCYFPPISVLSSMASTRCWASVVTDRLTVWLLSASVEIRSRDGEKGCWEGEWGGKCQHQSLPEGQLCMVTSTHFL